VIIIDNLQENFQKQPDNGIVIKAFTGDPKDTALIELTPILRDIYDHRVDDVRVALRAFNQMMLENIRNGVKNPHLNLTVYSLKSRPN